MADNQDAGFPPVSLPGGSFDREELEAALKVAYQELEGSDRDSAIKAAIVKTNASHVPPEFTPLGYKRVDRVTRIGDKDITESVLVPDIAGDVLELTDKAPASSIIPPASSPTPVPVASPAPVITAPAAAAAPVKE